MNSIAIEFDTYEALQKYLKEHPHADPTKHTVKKPVSMPGGRGPHQLDPEQTAFMEHLRKVKKREKDGTMNRLAQRIAFKFLSRTFEGDVSPSYGEQFQALKTHPPKLELRQGGMIAVMVFSPFVKNYIVSSEWQNKDLAMEALGEQIKAQHSILSRLENAMREPVMAPAEAPGEAPVAAPATDAKHPFKVGDILYCSWGYDQTNVDFYKVVDVRGKSDIFIAELDKQVVEGHNSPSEKVMPVLNRVIGEPMRRRPQGGGSRPYVRLNTYSSAYLWDGKPEYQTGAAYGR